MNDIERAAAILHAGGLVAFPTETVYGLGADATNPSAVERVFAAKGRPAGNPLIVHVSDAEAARQWTSDWPVGVDRLAARFWPGPLTIVLQRNRTGPKTIVDGVSAGGDTIGIRAPDHPVALQLLRVFRGPIAAPSANRSFHVSPTTADHVRSDLEGRVDLILDGGPCRVGIESTVLDMTGAPTILRPGQISREAIERTLGATVRLADISQSLRDESPARSPGQMEIHYAPNLPTFRFLKSARPVLESSANPSRKLMLLGGEKPMSLPRQWVMPTDPWAYAAELYRVMREIDAIGSGEIWIEMPPDEPAWAAVRDRLLRASRPGTP